MQNKKIDLKKFFTKLGKIFETGEKVVIKNQS